MSRKKRILIIDDDEVYLNLVTYILNDNGFIVETAQDGSEALEKDLDDMPDLILLDVVMNKMNGFQVAEALKSNEQTRRIKIILCSSRTSFDDIHHGMAVGADDYITKPFNPQDLLHRINVLLLKKDSETRPSLTLTA